jgi:hypothetical protein
MAHISGFAAERYGEVVQAVDASTAFSVGAAKLGDKAKLFTALSNSDTIMYRAVSLDDPSEWEVGLGTYASSTSTLARTTVLASSNSNNAVNFNKSDSSGANVKLEGLALVASTASAWTVSNFSADRTISASESTAANIAASLATLVNDLIAAGVIKGSVS